MNNVTKEVNQLTATLPPLTEFESVLLNRSALRDDEADLLWRQYSPIVQVDFPSPKTEGRWRLTAQGYAGYLPLGEGRGLELRPKVPVRQVWRMLDYAYFTDIKLFDEQFDCETFPELIERLAAILASRVLDRARRGLHRAYVPEAGRLSCVRGRIDLAGAMKASWVPEPHCHYRQHTGDIDDNRILTWTLNHIARSGLCHEPGHDYPGGALPLVRRAYRTLSGVTGLHSFRGSDCRGRRYNRLNGDYAILHALCRFFLDHLSPGHTRNGMDDSSDSNSMLSFVIPMDALFEEYVAVWLQHHLAAGWNMTTQEQYEIGQSGRNFLMDIVLYDESDRAQYIIDTKYKAPRNGQPATDDISQIISYAVAKGCREAVLLYPTPLSMPLDATINGIHVRSLTFSLDNKPDAAGYQFLRDLNLDIMPAPVNFSPS